MTLKRDGKIYEFFEELLDYQIDPYIWLALLAGQVVFLSLGWLAINWVFSAR